MYSVAGILIRQIYLRRNNPIALPLLFDGEYDLSLIFHEVAFSARAEKNARKHIVCIEKKVTVERLFIV